MNAKDKGFPMIKVVVFDALGRCSMCMPSERWLTPCSLWVNRQGLPFEAIGPRPRYVASDLTEVLEVIA